MSQSAKAQEPSMEEILASIRRIISDDDTAKAPAKPAPPPAPPPRPATLPPRTVSPPPAPPPPPPPDPSPRMNQSDIDAILAENEPPAATAPAEDILDLTESMAAPAPAASNFQTIDGQSDVVFTDTPQEPAPRAFDEARRQFTQTGGMDRSLLSNVTSQAVDSAFNSLAQTVLVQNARTLEDLVREMLRPMLKSWLDDNLPGMVERIVRAEIERVSRGRT